MEDMTTDEKYALAHRARDLSAKLSDLSFGKERVWMDVKVVDVSAAADLLKVQAQLIEHMTRTYCDLRFD